MDMIDNAATVSEGLPGIAMVGMAGRFPQAADINEFWNHLCAGRECLSRFSAAELRAAGVSPALLDDPHYVPVNGLLADIEWFDAEFFGMTPREASITDPQQRLFLELAWHALEHSGYDPARYTGAIGVYAGCGLSTYLLHNLWSNRARLADIGDLSVLMGNNKDYLPTRVSYKLNLTGPSVNINTACSTSLVAVHFACQALLECQCDMALAGGVGIQVPQVKGYLYQEGGILSPDGHCRAFDAAARGTVSGNGAAVVVLKRLADALACGDTVYAVIRGTAVNNDGADKAGYTAPSVNGQAQVITEAQAVAGVEAETIGFIETHGTGTALGDPIEIAALTQAFRQQTARTQFCAIGSVKTNVGHLDEAAGVAGLIKTVLSLYHRQIPPSLHFQKPNPEIDFAGSPFYVNTTLRHWPAPADGGPRRAAVSSFGIGGTNAHVVLEEAPPCRESSHSRSWQLLLLSARNPSALNTATINLADDLRQRSDSELADVAYTLQVGRRHFPYRKAVLCRSMAEAIQALDSGASQLAPPPRRPAEPSVVFLFPGQGAQHLNMGRDLYEGERLFREQVDHCAELLLPLLGYDLRELLYLEEAQAAAARLRQTAVAQPLLFVIEYALARLWMSWGIQPQAMLGHSLGEYVAACLAGVLSLPDALALVAERGRLMQALPPGAMLAVALAEDELRPLLNESLALAVVNAPKRCVVAGPAAAIAALAAELSGRAIECRPLETSHAFHSPMMEPIVQPFLERVRRIRLGIPVIPYLSNVTGTWITAAEATTPDYFAAHLRHAVRFSAGVDELLRMPERVFLEVGPGKSLTGIVASHSQRKPGHILINSLRHSKEKRSDTPVLLEALGKLWVAGAAVDWQAFSADEVRHRLPLPTYPFSRQRFWIDAADTSTGREDASPRRGKDIRDWFHALTWKRLLPLRPDAGRPTTNASWLVFMDESGLGDALLHRLRAVGATVVTVNAGKEFCRLDDFRYTIDPNCAQHYLDLIRQLRLHDRSLLSILHLWNVDPTGDQLHPLALHRSQKTGFYSLLWLAQALGSQNSAGAISIKVVTSNLQSVTGTEPLCPEKATVLGPVRVIPKEYPNIRCHSIDVVLPESGSWQGSALLEVLLAELQGGDSEPVIALRGACRWVPAFDPLRLEEPRELPATLREGGVYLITGGLGSMGLAFAKYLARLAHARLALVGRTIPPAIDGALHFDPSACAQALRSLEAESEQAVPVADLDAYPGLQSQLHALCSSLIYRYFVTSGVDLGIRRDYLRSELKGRLRIAAKFDRFFDFLLTTLAQDGLIALEDDYVRFLASRPLGSPEVLAQTLQQQHPQFQGLVRLVVHCAAYYRDALSGTIDSLSVLYPDGTARFMEECASATASYAKDHLYLNMAARVLTMVLAASQGRRIRILEVGGGEGRLTGAILESLRGYTVEYYFTDLGQSFVLAAQRKVAELGIDWMRFGRLDISRDPQAQGFEKHSFDLVLAYNVVHATPDIRQTTAHLHDLLAANGLLLLVEAIRLQRWDEMVWGLTEGWWHFRDHELRTCSPLLDLDQWETVLGELGFVNIKSYPEEDPRRRQTDAGLILAQRAEQRGCAVPAGVESASERPDRTTAKLQEIAALAADVVVFRADVSDLEAMRAVIAAILDRFGALHGIIHAAGVIGNGLIHAKTLAETEAVLAPKVTGACVLRETLREQGIEPDFLILCSSLSALAPLAGQVDYSAANAFLDAFAAYSSCRDGLRTTSIDWGFWQELGMIEKSRMPAEFKQAIVEEIAREGWSEAGVSAFSRILAGCPSSQIIVYPGDLASCLEGAAVCTASNDSGSFQSESIARIESKPAEESRPEHAATAVNHPLFGERVSHSAGIETWISRFRVHDFWVLDEHRPMGGAVLPGTAYLELARTAFERHADRAAIELRNVYFLTPLAIADDEEREVRTILRQQKNGYEFFVVSRRRPDGDLWLEHARGEVGLSVGRSTSTLDLQLLEARCNDQVIVFDEQHPRAELTAFERRIRNFRPRWQCLSWVRFGLQEALARLELPPDFRDEAEAYGLHPALLDMATGFLAIYEDLEELLPFSYQRVTVWEPLPASIFSHIRRLAGERPDEWQYDVTLTDTHGRILVEIAGYAFRRWRRETEQAQAGATAQSHLPAENLTVGIQTPGFLSTLTTRSAPRREPGRGEVEIEVCAAGLNFIEVLFAMGMLPAPDNLEAVHFGLECAGWIARVGEGVVEFAPGDAVIAIAPACFSTYTTVAENSVAHKPAALSLQEAATLPTVYATAYYALVTQGRLRQGEKVLIHSAAGGVGLAAVNIARWLGAQIFATAGTPEKREFLGALGIEQVLDSRSMAFADEIMQLTGGVGVDVVLNALGGEFITRSLAVLAPYGRFLELGKRDIFSGTVLPLAPFEKHLSFHALDFGLDLPDFQVVWRAVVRLLQEGVFPPLPYRLFPFERLSEAFEYMSQGRHIGKIVIAIQDRPRIVATTAVTPPARERPLRLIIGAEPEPAERAEKIPASGALTATVTAPSTTVLAAANPRPELSTPYREPTGSTEEQLVRLWQELFGIAPVGVEDNFFELNGDSLLAAQLVSRLYKLFEVKLAMSAIFENPTVAGLAEQIERVRNDRAAETSSITPVPPQPDYPLSHAQQRLWILSQNPAASVAYNMSYNLRLGGKLNVAALREAFTLLVERHESLRTAFITVKGVPRQQVRPAQPFELPVSDLRGEGNPTAAARQWIRAEAMEPFDLNQPPLLRARLLRLSEQEQVLLVSLHHIIADGISLNVLTRELHSAYTALCADRQPALPPLPIQYRDFAVWQQQQLSGETMQAHRAYWLEKLGGEPPLLDLPTDRTRPSLQQFSGAHVQVRLATAAREQLQQRCQEQGVSLFILLVAALKVLLHYTSGQTDILLGTPVINREQPELANQVGYYLNTLVLRDTVHRGEPFPVLLQRVRTTVTEAFAHQAYPFDRLVEELAIRPPPGRSPLFELQINLMPSEDLRLELGNLTVESFASEDETTLFDLNFMFTDGPAGLALEISYSTALFEAATVAQLGERLMRLLAAISEQPETPVRSLCKLFEAQEAAADKAAFLAGALALDEEF
jgi:acyl transferase domain-containing protein/NAD(P)-dependent dehydrogenase (short-subunit alcohol dehydrogenase family)/acyl carrier protein/2-polyprenyl-3-methyl-5-hydroxy-6-metoxy-1,4-benzoquinol methylase